MTNAMIEVMPVTAVCDNEGNTATISDGKPGKITRQLMKAYREKVEGEVND
jgi:branched-subunit amino acid aminotransferase/4-amino-4-deoxychorismate lyase